MGELLKGAISARSMNEETKLRVSALKKKYGQQPKIAIITAGKNDPLGSAEFKVHVDLARQLDIECVEYIFNDDVTEEELLNTITECNSDDSIHGILLLIPLPESINTEILVDKISPNKELEGLYEHKTKHSIFLERQTCLISALIKLISSVNYDAFDPHNRNIALLEDSFFEDNHVVKELIKIAQQIRFPLEVISTKELNIGDRTSMADLLLVSTESAESVTADMIKSGSIVIDFNPIPVGMTFSAEKNRDVPILKSSLRTEEVLAKAKYVGSVIGGIGPILLSILMQNVIYNFEQYHKNNKFS